MWDLPRPGLEPVSPALAGGFSTTAPPGKPPGLHFLIYIFNKYLSSTYYMPVTMTGETVMNETNVVLYLNSVL